MSVRSFKVLSFAICAPAMSSVGISYRKDRDQFVVRWKSGGNLEVPVKLADVASGRDAA